MFQRSYEAPQLEWGPKIYKICSNPCIVQNWFLWAFDTKVMGLHIDINIDFGYNQPWYCKRWMVTVWLRGCQYCLLHHIATWIPWIPTSDTPRALEVSSQWLQALKLLELMPGDRLQAAMRAEIFFHRDVHHIRAKNMGQWSMDYFGWRNRWKM